MEMQNFEHGEEAPSSRQEKIERADEVIAQKLQEMAARVRERMEQHKTVSLQGREYTIEGSYDERLAREQLMSAEIERELEQARAQEDYYLEKQLAEILAFSQLKQDVTARSAYISLNMPNSAEFLLTDDEHEHRDTPEHN